MKSTVLPSFHFSMNHQALPLPGPRARHTSTVRNVRILLSEKIVLFLHPRVDVPYSLVLTFSLDGKLCLRGGKNAAFV